ncbi:hypothetical protein FS749_015716 [Ceratobasidium sp. UAMH 11750]|nr:hypothetical protein FS749_015716 [Ceratobasidium sp. UAMH 11750]
MESITLQSVPASQDENFSPDEVDWEALMKALAPPPPELGPLDASTENWSGESDPDSEDPIDSSPSPTPGLTLSQSSSLPPSTSSSPRPPNHIPIPQTTETSPTPSISMISLWNRTHVDQWVDSLKDLRKCRDRLQSRPELKCPWDGCKTVCRRPQVLKEHLYVHLHIKPYKCSRPGCAAMFNTASNRRRHVEFCRTENDIRLDR